MPPRVLIPLVILAVAFWVVSIVDCALQPPSKHRGVSKTLWIVITVVLPVAGGILWFTIGRARKKHIDQSKPVGYATKISPEEEARRRQVQAETDARIEELEEQLRKLEAEEAAEQERRMRQQNPDVETDRDE